MLFNWNVCLIGMLCFWNVVYWDVVLLECCVIELLFVGMFFFWNGAVKLPNNHLLRSRETVSFHQNLEIDIRISVRRP